LATDTSYDTFAPNVRAFLADRPRYATIATLNRDGSPHQSVIWYLLRGDLIIVNSRVGRRWPANVRRDPRISFAVEEGENAVTMAGVAEIAAEGERAQADIAEMAWRYDEPDVAQREIARYRTEDRISFAILPTRVNVHGEPG
jgi:PPOX class probable F420-dependent enzyme